MSRTFLHFREKICAAIRPPRRGFLSHCLCARALDGEHLDPDGHKKLAAAIADIVRRDCEA